MEKIYTNTNATFTAANGEVVSYQEVFDSVRKNIAKYATEKGRLMSAEDLEDIFQESILKALMYSNSFNPDKAKVQTWASRIAKNSQIDAYKRKVKRECTFVPLESSNTDDDKYIAAEIESAAGGYWADHDLEVSENYHRIENAINSLKESYRFIISLQLEKMKPKDMAKIIGCTADAASTLLYRAHKALKKALGRDLLAEYGIAA